jgi:hypothetical protein
MIGKVTTWQMTPEQLAEYIEKHPRKPMKTPKRSSTIDHIDYKWRGKKGNESRWGTNDY